MGGRLYPLALKLAGQRVVVVGGGEVAARKVAGLLEAGGEVEVIAPRIGAAVRRLIPQGHLRLTERRFRPGDVRGARLVIAATDDPATNHAVWKAAQAQGVPVNVVDDPEHCDFYAPAVVRRGKVTVAISTGGSSPALAALLRHKIEECLPEWVASLANLLYDVRVQARERLPSSQQRTAFWRRVMAKDILNLVATEGLDAVQRMLKRELEEASR